ncbi:hypothetical protein ILUMI_18554 [Ignelater luminosus]|uniref:PiggyBac transposable element-derived protein domain-containing protein n=1 Tax=Ignelater luminosus TaxID=2038154 RepID=A0A8K0CHT0_IGNLU|nr:hypothetical protein ILUMI_18554 [Ignelater luminosus]
MVIVLLKSNSDVAENGLIVTVNNEANALGRIINFADESDQEEPDNEIQSEHDTESEQEWDSSDEEPGRNETNTWYGKDQTEWSKILSQRGRTPAHNIISVLPGLRGPACQNQSSSPLESWQLLLPDSVLEEIVNFANKKVATARGKYKRFKRSCSSRTLLTPTFVKDTDLLEIKAFLDLLYLQGFYKSRHEDMRSLWATKGKGRPIFRATMSLARFSFLLSCLRFDDLDTRIERSKTNKLAAIFEIFQKCVENCKACCCLGAYVTVDELLIPFRGRYSFKMYMPNKPAKYGIRVQILADAKTHYMCMSDIYAGAEVSNKNKENFKLANPTRVVLRLAAPIFGTNRNITADNWYSSVELVEELPKHNITYVGTLKKKK